MSAGSHLPIGLSVTLMVSEQPLAIIDLGQQPAWNPMLSVLMPVSGDIGKNIIQKCELCVLAHYRPGFLQKEQVKGLILLLEPDNWHKQLMERKSMTSNCFGEAI
jgi:hypothetical protein